MDLLPVILHEHSKEQAKKIVRYVGADAKRFSGLVQIFLKGPYRVTQRAAWPVSLCVERHPALVQPHLKKLVLFAGVPGTHPAVKRNIMRLLQFIDIPVRHQGDVARVAFDLLQDVSQPGAVRVFAMQVIANLCDSSPDLKKELLLILEAHLPYGTPAFLSRAKKIIKLLRQ